jgi:hypothetical protein
MLALELAAADSCVSDVVIGGILMNDFLVAATISYDFVRGVMQLKSKWWLGYSLYPNRSKTIKGDSAFSNATNSDQYRLTGPMSRCSGRARTAKGR